jgi:hypothetical protein
MTSHFCVYKEPLPPRLIAINAISASHTLTSDLCFNTCAEQEAMREGACFCAAESSSSTCLEGGAEDKKWGLVFSFLNLVYSDHYSFFGIYYTF